MHSVYHLSVVYLLSLSVYVCFCSFSWHFPHFVFFFLKTCFYFTCGVFCLCNIRMQCPRKPEDSTRSSGIECWQPNQDPLKKQHVLSSTEPPLHCLVLFLWFLYVLHLDKFKSIMLGAIAYFSSFGPHLGDTNSSITSADLLMKVYFLLCFMSSSETTFFFHCGVLCCLDWLYKSSF